MESEFQIPQIPNIRALGKRAEILGKLSAKKAAPKDVAKVTEAYARLDKVVKKMLMDSYDGDGVMIVNEIKAERDQIVAVLAKYGLY